MARPERNNVDYFPFYCEEGKKMFYLEENYGNDGFATFLKLLRELAKTDFHYLDLSNKTTLMFLSAKCKVSKEILENIINDLVDLEKFDKVLWHENNIIWCQDFVDSISDAYNKRKNKCISYEGLLLRLQGLGIRKPNKCTTIAPVNPQRKEKKSKVKKRKEDDEGKTNVYDFSILDVQEFKDVRELKNYYLNNLRLMNALCDNKKNRIKFDDLPKRLEQFTTELESSGRFKETFTEYSQYFRNWIRKVPHVQKNKLDNKGRIIANFSNPIL
jgi:hypothetical protein